jgi:glycosyltransferase involved in cell wall biosynthesis
MQNVYAIIANHNYGKYVGQAIESALNQLHPTKVCIIDDGSTDDSVEIIGRALNISTDQEINESNGHYFIKQQPCLGASEARNKAINLVWDKADFFLILDADDEAYPDKVQTMLRYFYPGVAAVYGDYHILNTINGNKVPEYKKPFDVMLLNQECIVHSQSLIKKECLEQVLEDGRVYDPELHKPRLKDGKKQIRLARKFMIWHVPQFLSLVRATGENQSSPENITPEIYQSAREHMRRKNE